MLDRLWSETLRHRPFDLGLAFLLAAVVSAFGVALIKPGDDSRPAQGAARGPVAPAPADTTTSPTPDAAPMYGPLVIAPLSATGVKGAVQSGAVGGVLGRVAFDKAGQKATKSEVRALGESPGLLRLGLIPVGADDPLSPYLCRTGADNPASGVANAAVASGFSVLYGVVGNYTPCALREGDVRAVFETLRARGIEPVLRGYSRAVKAQTGRQPGAGVAEGLGLVEPPEIVAPSYSLPSADGRPALDDPRTSAALRKRLPAVVVLADVDELAKRLRVSRNAALVRAARAGADLFLFSSADQDDWRTASATLDRLAQQSPPTRQRLQRALDAVVNLAG